MTYLQASRLSTLEKAPMFSRWTCVFRSSSTCLESSVRSKRSLRCTTSLTILIRPAIRAMPQAVISATQPHLPAILCKERLPPSTYELQIGYKPRARSLFTYGRSGLQELCLVFLAEVIHCRCDLLCCPFLPNRH